MMHGEPSQTRIVSASEALPHPIETGRCTVYHLTRSTVKRSVLILPPSRMALGMMGRTTSNRTWFSAIFLHVNIDCILYQSCAQVFVQQAMRNGEIILF